jgi:hypothetical protein
LRFLRARKWVTTAGVNMIAACLKWRMESNVEEVIAKGEEGMLKEAGFMRYPPFSLFLSELWLTPLFSQAVGTWERIRPRHRPSRSTGIVRAAPLLQ